MTQPFNEECFKITAPLIEQPFKSKLYWDQSLRVAARSCPKNEHSPEGLRQCHIQKCVDAALIRGIRQGGAEAVGAWNKLYTLYANDLHTWVVYKGCKDEALARDIVHDVLVRFRDLIYEKGIVLESATLKTYLYRSAFHKWIDHTKKSMTNNELLPGVLPEPVPKQPADHIFEKVRQFIKLYRGIFPDPEDNCLKLMKYVYLEKMSYKEILVTKVGRKYGTEKTLGNRVRNCTEKTMAKLTEANFKKEFEDIFGQYRIKPEWIGGEHGKA